jgi:hypothetical protein
MSEVMQENGSGHHPLNAKVSNPDWLHFADASDRLGVPVRTLATWALRGSIESVEHPEGTKVSVFSIKRYMTTLNVPVTEKVESKRPRDLVRLSDVCKNMGVTYKKVYAAIYKGQMNHYKSNKKTRGRPAIMVSKAEFAKFVETRPSLKLPQKKRTIKPKPKPEPKPVVATTTPVMTLEQKLDVVLKRKRGLELALHFGNERCKKHIEEAMLLKGDVSLLDRGYRTIVSEEVSRMLRRLAGRMEAAADESSRD